MLRRVRMIRYSKRFACRPRGRPRRRPDLVMLLLMMTTCRVLLVVSHIVVFDPCAAPEGGQRNHFSCLGGPGGGTWDAKLVYYPWAVLGGPWGTQGPPKSSKGTLALKSLFFFILFWNHFGDIFASSFKCF